uniref:Cytochrome C biogenesis protein transmembrane domain-containing protein n=1 Tax=Pseudo-nitzschia australis TaxID=44445 RepID=A0A6V0C3S7_9STRA|mmetsp:Transcript_9664/g.20945  ORF Transcript_9664/g.20945 Transcript_9664/m.20945 type:complete len:372 (+) Transcript_9664:313-1428(+)|eukprot:CAMPEP_0168182422 /NCGR_PEP_ID=MMETSP0139_2-20121125/11886_1 /TAXON_ID=44445 /ORGANISM="Pseudo-nitzschia australis, Strain 10249 10 AB" /LENGTH=371 /DNA_ID=CAMNT_0008103353 /DNA_START=232 /DNA_END=1347 /DNA_ORIENTATION=+
MLAGLRKGRCDGDSSPLLNMMRNTCGVMTMLLMLVTKTHAFQTAPKPALPTSASRSQFRGDANGSSVRQRSSELNMMNWEDVMFNAQTTASSMASVSLDDPSNLISSVPIMYGAGLLTAFSPCVWGLLPLTISYISTAAGEREDKKIVLPTLSFAFGLASVFCSLGLIAASVGGAVYGNSGNTNIILPIFSNAICCIMAFQLLELVDIPLPALSSPATAKTQSSDEPILISGSGKILSSAKDESARAKGEQGSLFRTFLLGGSSALVASPCATPVLTSILAFVASSSNPLLGGFLLLFYTLGYSTPLLVTAATGGKALVGLKELGGKDDKSIYASIAPWVTPFTAGILLWYGTNGLLTAVLGDPSLAGLLS